MTSPTFTESPIPADTPPPTDGGFVGEYPDSTPEAPYGYKSDGSPRVRRPYAPRGSGGKSASSRGARMPARESEAKAAAALLAQVNGLATMGIMAVGFTETASAVNNANEGFEQMAYEALLTDPALCKTILKAGTTSGKVALIIAYGMLTASVAPVAMTEYRIKRDAIRAARLEAEGNENAVPA